MRERLLDLCWNGQARRPRLPWRVAAVFVVLALAAAGVSLAAPSLRASAEALLGLALPGAQATAAAGNLVFVASQAVVYVSAVYLTGRFVDRRRFRDFGLRLDRDWWLDLGFGLVLGAALMTGVFLLVYAAGWVAVTGTFRIDQAGFAFWPWFGWALLTFVAIGVTEELLVRGYLITNVSEGVTWFDRVDGTSAVAIAVLGSSLVFAYGHLTNPNASLASAAGILVAAVMLGTAYALTGELAIPVSVHVTWNFFQGPVYGFPVSGIDFGLSVLAIRQTGPARYTGGRFGPEAGVLGVAASVAGIGLVLLWVRWRDGRLRVQPSITTPNLLAERDD